MQHSMASSVRDMGVRKQTFENDQLSDLLQHVLHFLRGNRSTCIEKQMSPPTCGSVIMAMSICLIMC